MTRWAAGGSFPGARECVNAPDVNAGSIAGPPPLPPAAAGDLARLAAVLPAASRTAVPAMINTLAAARAADRRTFRPGPSAACGDRRGAGRYVGLRDAEARGTCGGCGRVAD